MSFHTLVFQYSNTTTCRLDDFLLLGLPKKLEVIKVESALSKSKLRRLIMAGAVSINGQQDRNAARLLKCGNSIIVRLDTEKFAFEKKPDDIVFELTPDRILFEDDAILVVNKPSGFPTEATIVQSRDHLQAAVCRFLSFRDGIVNPYVGLHHRLDRETSGVILFTKQRSANAAVHRIFLEHLAKKTYEALTVRPARLPKTTFSVIDSIGRISPKSAAGKWGTVKQGGDPAQTDFLILEEHQKGLRIQAMPLTGRTHQIRVHLSGLGMPLLGDILYGGPVKLNGIPIPRIMLHAAALAFPHPIDGRQLIVNAPIPADFLDCLKNL